MRDILIIVSFFFLPALKAENFVLQEKGFESYLTLAESKSEVKNIPSNDFNQEIDLKENILDSNEDFSNMYFFWKATFEIQSFTDETKTNGVVSTKIYGEFKWDLTKELAFQLQALFIGRNGFTQSIYDRRDRSRGLYLLESFFKWKADSSYSFQFGNINQGFLEAPLLMTDKTFPSFILRYHLEDFYNFKSHFLVQGSIPDNASESVFRETQVIKGFPSFSVASFNIKNLNSNFDFFNRFTFFHYYNLSQAVAERSRIFQNTVERTGSDSIFKYDYYGFHNHIKITKRFLNDSFLKGDWAGEWGLEYIHNLGASSHINEGYRTYLRLYHNFNHFVELIGELENFLNQSNSSVAYYNSEFYGHNGRKGFALKMQAHFYDSNLNLGVSLVNSKPIDEDDKTVIGPSTAFQVFLTTNRIGVLDNRRIKDE
ncbi:MAG: hypothetical protein GDA46_02750 [Bdellovibrionales bacterium]|nr:hypothetical protein [Bdellovibrionales bacterium]